MSSTPKLPVMNITETVIKSLIQKYNIFDGNQVVKQSQVWQDNFPDVPSINAHASSAVLTAVKQVREGSCKVRGITITADKGFGKTHLISRIRHQLKSEDNTLFIYMSEYENLNNIKSEFLEAVISSLKHDTDGKVSQWQEVATALINRAYKETYKTEDLLRKFPSVLVKNPNLLDTLTTTILRIKPDIDPYLVRAILWTLNENYAPYASKWLAGEELPQSFADKLGLPTTIKDSFQVLCQLLDLVSAYKVPVICFDELDSADHNNFGYTRAQVVASLIKDLYNDLECGVFLTAMYPATWTEQIGRMPGADAVVDRIAEFTSKKPIQLTYLTDDDILNLVSYRLKKLCSVEGINLPSPIYPFKEDELRKLSRQGVTAREVLAWCAEQLDDGVKVNKVEIAFNEELNELTDFIEDKTKIAQALIFGCRRLIDQTLENVRIDNIQAPVSAKIDFKIVGEENGKPVSIGVAVIQESGGVSMTAGLNHLTSYQQYGLTRGCLVRSKTIPAAAQVAQRHLNTLLQQLGGEWVMLKEEEIKPLIAIWSVYQDRESRGLSDEAVLNFIAERGLIDKNPLILEILSDPSGQVPQEATNEEAEFQALMREESDVPVDVNALDALLANI